MKKNFSRKILNIAFAVLFIGIISFAFPIYIKYNSVNMKAGLSLLNSVENIMKTDNSISNEKLKTLFQNNKGKFKFYNKELKYIAIFKYPKNYNGNKDTTPFKDAEYIYPSVEELNNDLKEIGYIANSGEGSTYLDYNNEWYISAGCIEPRLQWYQYALDVQLKSFSIVCTILSLVLFTIVALIEIHCNKKVSSI